MIIKLYKCKKLNKWGCRNGIYYIHHVKNLCQQGNPLSNTIKDTSTIMHNAFLETNRNLMRVRGGSPTHMSLSIIHNDGSRKRQCFTLYFMMLHIMKTYQHIVAFPHSTPRYSGRSFLTHPSADTH